MSVEDALSRIDSALRELANALRRGGDNQTFEIIFAVNNEIGRAFRVHPQMSRGLLDLQSQVNLITINLKAGERVWAQDALESSLLEFAKLKEEHGSPKKEFITKEGFRTPVETGSRRGVRLRRGDPGRIRRR